MTDNTEIKRSLILIIEDEGLLSKMYADKLTEDGYDCRLALGGNQGLAMARELKPDLVVCDIIMQDVDGLSILTMLKKEDPFKNVPFIMLSNLDQEEYVKHAMENGATAYLIKSNLMPEDIVKKIEETLQFKG
jgi:DNA-binding response OmpR family regulator